MSQLLLLVTIIVVHTALCGSPKLEILMNKTTSKIKQEGSTSKSFSKLWWARKIPIKQRMSQRKRDIYKENKNFEKWSAKLTKIHKSVKKDYGCTCGISETSRIINGEEVTAKKYPWMAAIVQNPDEPGGMGHYCGGSVISDKAGSFSSMGHENACSGCEIYCCS